jgi:hypothetical protein
MPTGMEVCSWSILQAPSRRVSTQLRRFCIDRTHAHGLIAQRREPPLNRLPPSRRAVIGPHFPSVEHVRFRDVEPYNVIDVLGQNRRLVSPADPFNLIFESAHLTIAPTRAFRGHVATIVTRWA